MNMAGTYHHYLPTVQPHQSSPSNINNWQHNDNMEMQEEQQHRKCIQHVVKEGKDWCGYQYKAKSKSYIIYDFFTSNYATMRCAGSGKHISTHVHPNGPQRTIFNL